MQLTEIETSSQDGDMYHYVVQMWRINVTGMTIVRLCKFSGGSKIDLLNAFYPRPFSASITISRTPDIYMFIIIVY